jgi:galactokinase
MIMAGMNEGRLEALKAAFSRRYGTQGRRLLAVVAPARTEICGNHTDHEGGHVVAGAVNRSILGVAAANGTDRVNVASEGFEPFSISLDSLEPSPDEHVTTAGLVRGMAHELAATGRTPAGFDLAMTSDIPSGGGLSSSAALELALGRVMESLWKGPGQDAAALAKMGQVAENRYFGKACGLMDQMAVAVGGIAFMDFFDSTNPRVEKLDFDFEQAGYAICLVDVGCDHSRFTDEYTAVPTEMQAVAHELGATKLSMVDGKAFDAAVPQLRRRLGDRAVLRALHYFREEALVDLRRVAMEAGDIDAFLELERESGASSAMFLQNVSTGGAYQPAMVAIGLAERLLAGHGAVRIHGGGFGGSIQAFVPVDQADAFARGMGEWLGEGSCERYAIDHEGARAAWL